MLIDTGADVSLFPLSFASLLGISAERDLMKAPTKGIGADRDAFMLRLPPPIMARVQTEVFALPEVRFIEGNSIPPILGRDALFGDFELRMNRDEIVLSRWP